MPLLTSSTVARRALGRWKGSRDESRSISRSRRGRGFLEWMSSSRMSVLSTAITSCVSAFTASAGGGLQSHKYCISNVSNFSVFGQKLKNLVLAKHYIIGKGISRGAEWCKFQLRSTFHFGVKGPQRKSSISVKMPYYSPWFSAKN